MTPPASMKRPNERTALDGGIPRMSQVECARPATSECGRWATRHTIMKIQHIIPLLLLSICCTVHAQPTSAQVQSSPFKHAVFISGGHSVTGTFMLSFCLTNVSKSVINPKPLLEGSSLKVNGKEVAHWPLTISNGPRDSRWTALPAGEHLEFAYAMGEPDFRPQGAYDVVWVIQGQASRPFRIKVK